MRDVDRMFICLTCSPPNCEDVELCKNASQCWKTRFRDSDGFESVARGCTIDKLLISYCGVSSSAVSHVDKNTDHYNGQFAIECCRGDYCNNGSFPVLPPLPKNDPVNQQERYEYVVKFTTSILGPLFVLGVLTFAAVFYLKRKYKKKMYMRSAECDEGGWVGDSLIRSMTAVGDSTLKEYMDQSITSGSGFGLPLLMQRTLGRQVSLVELIGKGKYGEVWRGILNGENVAVKIFLSKDEVSWRRETEIYNTVLMRHSNILEYIGSDITSRNSFTQFWLVTDFQAYGSLYDYLNKNYINYKKMINFCLSTVSGLEYLHSEILGSQNKPAIAHRDIKTKNILVKSDGECVIADFGLAVTNNDNNNIGQVDVGINPKAGTKRYMPPEILDETINMDSFESFRKADIYSFSLVMWEICWRTLSNGIIEDYRLPFFECTPSDPSFEDMRKVVCVEQRRPLLPNRWISDLVMNEMVSLMKECWHQSSSVRLTALRIKKNITKLSRSKLLDCEFV